MSPVNGTAKNNAARTGGITLTKAVLQSCAKAGHLDQVRHQCWICVKGICGIRYCIERVYHQDPRLCCIATVSNAPCRSFQNKNRIACAMHTMRFCRTSLSVLIRSRRWAVVTRWRAVISWRRRWSRIVIAARMIGIHRGLRLGLDLITLAVHALAVGHVVALLHRIIATCRSIAAGCTTDEQATTCANCSARSCVTGCRADQRAGDSTNCSTCRCAIDRTILRRLCCAADGILRILLALHLLCAELFVRFALARHGHHGWAGRYAHASAQRQQYGDS